MSNQEQINRQISSMKERAEALAKLSECYEDIDREFAKLEIIVSATPIVVIDMNNSDLETKIRFKIKAENLLKNLEKIKKCTQDTLNKLSV